jgi:glycosyltransferase involved in cell wall biosynthesis
VNNNIKVSIIVPVYKVEKYVGKCIESLLSQTYTNIEIILVNDGSPDRSPEICEKYAQIDNRVRVIHKSNGGLSDARNVGLDNCQGDYVMFVDSDDYVEEKLIEDCVSLVIEHETEVIIMSYFVDTFDQNEVLLSSFVSNNISGKFERKNFKDIKLTKELIGVIGYAWNKFYNKTIFKKNKINFEKGLSLVEDVIFNSHVLKCTNKITFVNEPYVHYIQRPRETLGTKYYKDFYEMKIEAMNALKSLFFNWGIESNVIANIMNELNFDNIKINIDQISNSSNIAPKRIKKIISDFLKSEEVEFTLKTIENDNYHDKYLKYLMVNKKSSLLFYYYKLKKVLRK